MKNNLPSGWYWGKVADAYEVVKTKMDPTAADAVPYIGLEHLSSGGGINSIGSSEELQSIKGVFEPGDVLYGKLRPYLNKHAVVDFAGVCSTDILVFRSKSHYPAQLLDYFLGLPSVIKRANEESKGINLPRVNAATLLNMDMPIAPATEAERIVEQLQSLMQKLEASQERLDKLPTVLKKFRQAVLAAAVSGQLTQAWRGGQPHAETSIELLNRIRNKRRTQWEDKQRTKLKGKQLSLNDDWKQKYDEPVAPDASDLPELPASWTWTGFQELADLEQHALKAGPFGSALKKDYYTTSGYKIYGQEQVIRQDADYGDYFIDQVRYESLISCRVKPGDILISLVGTIGKALILPKGCLPGIINPRLVKLSLNKETVVPEYAKIYIDSPTVKQHFVSVSHGGTMDILNLSLLKELPVPLPPFEEQQEIVRQVNHYFVLADQLEARLDQAVETVEQLPQALLAKAFSGQLVPQDPSDEPASALLERSQTTASAPAKAKGKRGRQPKALTAPLFE